MPFHFKISVGVECFEPATRMSMAQLATGIRRETTSISFIMFT